MGNGLKSLRVERGWTHEQAADAVGISRSQFIKLERGERKLTQRTIELASAAFDVAKARVLDEAGQALAEIVASNVRFGAQASTEGVAQMRGPRNVPVYGTSVGGEDGDFQLNGQIIDHAPRPPGIADRQGVFVVYLVGDSVSPKYEDGDPLYIDTNRRPQPRDYVFIELHGEEGPGASFIKRLVKRTASKLVVSQHTPEKEIEFDLKEVKFVYRVIPYPELIGV